MVDYEYYSTVYKGNSIPETDFERLAIRASSYLDSIAKKIDPDSAPIKMATCAVAEAWQINEQGGDISSQSVGPWSKSFNKETKRDSDRLYEAAKLYMGPLISRARWA